MFYRVRCLKTGQRFSFFSREELRVGEQIAFVPDDGGHFICMVERESMRIILGWRREKPESIVRASAD